MNVFSDRTLLTKIEELKKNPIQYYIGVDSYSDDTESSYCLGYKRGDTFEILLAKNEENKDSFMEEVNNLMKYFNAVIIEENGETKRTKRIKG